MHDDQDFPTQLAGDIDDRAGALRWTSRVIALTALALALLNAGAIAAWAADLTPGPGTARAVMVAERWRGTTAAAGLDTGYSRLHALWTRLEAARWAQPHDALAQQKLDPPRG